MSETQAISDSIIEEAWSEVSAIHDPRAARSLAAGFAASQPALSAFLSEAFDGLSAEAADLGFFAAFVVWRCFERAHGGALGAVDSSAVVACYRENDEWLERVGEGEAILLAKKLRDVRRYDEPDVMRYVIEAVLDAHEDGIDLRSDEQERLFVTLKIVTDCLSEAASSGCPDPQGC